MTFSTAYAYWVIGLLVLWGVCYLIWSKVNEKAIKPFEAHEPNIFGDEFISNDEQFEHEDRAREIRFAQMKRRAETGIKPPRKTRSDKGVPRKAI